MKRILSLILATVMLCAMLPASFAEEPTEPMMKYVFSASGYASEKNLLVDDIKGFDEAEEPKWANAGTNPWRMDGKEYLNRYVLTAAEAEVGSYIRSLPNALSVSYWKMRAWDNGTDKKDAAFALLLEVDKTGSFTPVLTYEGNPKSCIWDVYLIPKTEVDNTSYKDKFGFKDDGAETRFINNLKEDVKAKYKIGTLDTYAAASVTKTAYFRTYDIESSGEYYLFLQCNGINPAIYSKSDSWLATNLFSFELYNAGEIAVPKLSTVNVKLGENSVPQGKATDTEVSFLLDNGDKPTQEYEYVLSSTDTDVATVDSATGVVTALAPGETQITASVATADGTVTGFAALTVTQKPYLKEFKLSKKSLALFNGYDANNSEKISYTAIMSDGEEKDAASYNPTVESLDESIAVIDAETGTITAVSCGKTTIRVSAKNEKNELCEGNLIVEVREREGGLSYKFGAFAYEKKTEITRSDFGALDLEEQYAYADTDPWRVDGQTYADSYLSATPSKIPEDDKHAAYKKPNALSWRHGKNRAWAVTPATETTPLVTKAKKESAIALVLDVQKVGKFTPTMTYQATKNACIYDVYLVPKSVVDSTSYKDSFTLVSGIDENGNPVFGYAGNNKIGQYIDGALDTEKYFIGKLDMYSAEEMTRTTVLENVEISTAGEHYILFRCNGVNEAIQKVDSGYACGNLYSIDFHFIPDTPLISTGAVASKSELLAGDTAVLTPQPQIAGGKVINTPAVITEMFSENDVATVEGTTLITHKAGNVRIRVESHRNGDEEIVTGYLDLAIAPEGMTDIEVTAGGSPRIRLTERIDDTMPVYIKPISNMGRELEAANAKISVISKTPELAYINSEMQIFPVAEGNARFEVTVELSGRRITKEATLPVVLAKTEASFMTALKAETARENASKYDWAKTVREGYVNKAEKYVNEIDSLYSLIHSEGLARGYTVGNKNDPNAYTCRYCNVDLRKKYGAYSWLNNALTRPWKTQCPDCKRLFPSNNFEGFYELGLNEYGEFDRLRALAAHHRLIHHGSADFEGCVCEQPESQWSAEWNEYYGYGVKGGYLYNELYPEIGDKNADGSYKVQTINAGEGLRVGETIETWGVDDGFGYVPKMPDGTPYECAEGIIERHTYIAQYVFFGIWRGGAVDNAIKDTANAYFYTGDKKYGRIAAILLDRVADFFPQYSTEQYNKIAPVNGNGNVGKLVGSIWDTETATAWIKAYDMVFDMYEDEYVLGYIRSKADQYKMNYAKETPSQIRTNIEDGLVRNSLESVRDWKISGNYGMEQETTVTAAVVLDTHPESQQWLDFLMATGWDVKPQKTGGGIYSQLTDEVDADGQGTEGSSYNVLWLDNLRAVNEVLVSNPKYLNMALSNHPKFIQMHYANIPMMSTYYTPKIGDSGSTAGIGHWISTEEALSGWKLTGDYVFAQILYLLNGNSAEGLHYSITENSPERLESEVQSVINEHGKFTIQSDLMANFGFAMLRRGGDYTDGTGNTAKDTSRHVWMYFGTNTGHGHFDTLNLGLTAFGLNFLPDLGYPEQTSYQPNRLQWVRSTTSHNTVVVDEDDQLESPETRGKVKHFDDDGMVALMDVSAKYVYDSTDEYRRSVVQIDADDENSYVVDFFRVLGGNDHLYSFHASSNEVNGVSGLELVPQTENGKYKGSYAGIDVPYGQDPNSPPTWNYKTDYPRGYTWLKNVDRDEAPTGKFEVDFAIKDFRKSIKNSDGLALHFTMHNEGNAKQGVKISASIADGLPPQKADNKSVDKLKYLLVKHTGEELDTVFTAILEPYRTTRFIKESSELDMRVVGDVPESKGDAHRALRIEHENGRVDYVLYSTNNMVTYEITLDDGSPLVFRGFVGVYTVNKKGANTYKYLCDGDILGEETGEKGSIEGTVKSFAKGSEILFENEITITPEFAVELTEEQLLDLGNRYVHIDNGDKARSGTFKINSARQVDGDIILDIGLITPVRKYKDANDFSKGFEYMLSEGQKARIPLTYSENEAPTFDEVSDSLSTSADSTISFNVCAESKQTITYIGSVLPRGASVNGETGLVTWKPTASQIGKNHFAITAQDADGRESTVHFYVTVYGSTTGGSSTDNSGTSGESSASSGGGGGGGGGAAPTDKPDDAENTDKNVENENVNTAPDASGETDIIRFTDLSNHAWAADAINALAADGIIKGTSASTFSPKSNITRADFALLLVRAFELESENAENFADVSANDYFASELATARNTGIVNGIGDNKFAPRNSITRQDMMVIVYRAMQKLNVGFGVCDEPQYEDFATVAPYARDAVSALISAGFVNGNNGCIAPTDYTTRAEVAVLIKRILNSFGEK